jgi:hypothetical protein
MLIVKQLNSVLAMAVWGGCVCLAQDSMAFPMNPSDALKRRTVGVPGSITAASP